MGLSGPLGVLALLVAFVQIGLAVAIAVMVRQELWNFAGTWPSSWAHTSPDNVCLMTTGSVNLCAFSYVVMAVGLAASCLAVLTQCISRGSGRRGGGCCGCSCYGLDLFVAVLAGIMWTAAAITCTVYGVRADEAGVPKQAARTAVWAMAWAQAGLWILSALLAIGSRRAARREYSEAELSSSMRGSGDRYQRYNDTPFADKTSKWQEVRAAYLSRKPEAGIAPKVLNP